MTLNNETENKKSESYYGEHQLKEVLFTLVYTVILILLMWGVSSFMY